MKQPLSLFSEEYTSHGNVAAEGILNQLGRPGLDLLTLLVRETVQNSLDARLREDEAVDFAVTGRTLTPAQLDFLRTMILVASPDNLKIREAFSSGNPPDGVQVLIISDRGTTGLNGPIRANTPDDSSGSRNFVNFFFNTGQSKGKQFSGGTYGYGKSILYRVSKVHTICAYTRCQVDGKFESRFMAAALDPHEEEKQAGYRQYTGRHWWGRESEKDSVHEPVVGQDADEIARELGIPVLRENEQGTICMVLCPVLSNLSLERIMRDISRILLWYAWPAMITRANGIPAMRFAVSYEEQDVPIPDPSTYPPLNGFVDAMRLLQDNQQDSQDYMWQVSTISSQRPRQLLGKLALLRFLRAEREASDLQSIDDISATVFPITRASQHVALMRNINLVVKYFEGTNLPGSRFEYAGVFIADRTIDAVFAKAEPPTHDNWNPQTITDRQEKTFVNVALRDIKKAVTDFTAPLPVVSMGEKIVPLGTFADQLAGFMIGVKGSSANIPSPTDRSIKPALPQQTGTGSLIDLTNSNQPGLPASNDQQKTADATNSSKTQALSFFDVPTNLFGPEQKDEENVVETTSDYSDQAPNGHIVAKTPGNQKKSFPLLSGSRKQAKIYQQGGAQLELLENIPVLVTAFYIEHAPGSQASLVEVQAAVMLDNGQEEDEPPTNHTQPEVLAWITSDGKERSGSETIRIPCTDVNIWKVAVSVPEDAKIQVDLTVSGVF